METNKLTKEINDILHPRVALIAYASREGESFFVEAREIDGKGKMGEGVPVTVEFMNELVRGYSEHRSNTPYGRIPSNMLWCDSRKGSEKYVWYNPPRKRMMFFKESLKVENAEYNLPGIIYETNGNSLNIYVYKDKVLTDETELYAAPFFNVTGVSVCLGSAKIVDTN